MMIETFEKEPPSGFLMPYLLGVQVVRSRIHKEAHIQVVAADDRRAKPACGCPVRGTRTVPQCRFLAASPLKGEAFWWDP